MVYGTYHPYSSCRALLLKLLYQVPTQGRWIRRPSGNAAETDDLIPAQMSIHRSSFISPTWDSSYLQFYAFYAQITGMMSAKL